MRIALARLCFVLGTWLLNLEHEEALAAERDQEQMLTYAKHLQEARRG